MRGYKVFHWRHPRVAAGSSCLDDTKPKAWHGPYYDSRAYWKVEVGAVLDAEVGDRPARCGPGVNFFKFRADVDRLLEALHSGSKYFGPSPIVYRVFRVETLPDAEIVDHSATSLFRERKARASAVRLVEDVTEEFPYH